MMNDTGNNVTVFPRRLNWAETLHGFMIEWDESDFTAYVCSKTGCEVVADEREFEALVARECGYGR